MHLNAFKKCLRQMEHQYKELKKKPAHDGERRTFRKHNAPVVLPQRKTRENGGEKEASFFKDYRNHRAL